MVPLLDRDEASCGSASDNKELFAKVQLQCQLSPTLCSFTVKILGLLSEWFGWSVVGKMGIRGDVLWMLYEGGKLQTQIFL